MSAVDVFVRALTEGSPAPSPETLDALHGTVADDVDVLAGFGVGTGIAAVDHLVGHPLVRRLAGSATWSDPLADGDRVVVEAVAPPAASVGGLRFGFHLDAGGRIDRIEQDIIPAAPRAPDPVSLTDAHAELLTRALDNGTPVIVGYVDAEGRPKLSYRATVQVLGPDRLSMWIRDPDGGLVRALATNANLACFYSDRSAGITLQFYGRGHVEPDEAIRNRTYDDSPKPERDMDWRRQGVAVVIDVDRVEGRDAGGRVLMARDAR